MTKINAYPTIKKAVVLCLILLGIEIFAGIILALVLGFIGVDNKDFIEDLAAIYITLAAFCVVLIIGYKETNKKFNEIFKFNKISLNLWIAVIIFMFGFIIISSEIDNLLNFILPMPEFMVDVFKSMLSSDYLVISIIMVGIMPAFLEEMLFRGIILGGFRENYSQRKAIVVSALLFGLAHLNPWQFVSSFIIGLIMAWIFIKTESILPCIYMHLFNNLLAVLVMKFGDTVTIRGFNSDISEHAFQPLWFNSIGIVLTGIGILLLINCIYRKDRVS
jgi:membrane protease YdiL (CAAX protease family)